jgi:ketosteroid isomerase-like protein
MTDARVAAWLDKEEIRETIYRFARGLDRCDESLLRAVFHADATDDHGVFRGTATDFVTWVLPVLRGMTRTQHTIGNVLIELAGERAFSESYFTAYHRVVEAGAERDLVAAGRYLDRFEKRAGTWRIVHRHAVYDWSTNLPASDDAWGRPPQVALLDRGRRDPTDASYVDREAHLGIAPSRR